MYLENHRDQYKHRVGLVVWLCPPPVEGRGFKPRRKHLNSDEITFCFFSNFDSCVLVILVLFLFLTTFWSLFLTSFLSHVVSPYYLRYYYFFPYYAIKIN